MKTYAMYDLTTGMIKGTGITDSLETVHLRSNCEMIQTSTIINPNLKYIDVETKKIKDRPTNSWPSMISVLSNEPFTIDNVPNETNVLLDGEELGVITDGTLELNIPLEGKYKLTLKSPFPYYEYNVTVEVTPNG